jgi:hypothetical protein
LSNSQLAKFVEPSSEVEQHDMSPLQCKEAGNSAFKKGALGEAICLYNKGPQCLLELSASQSSALNDVKCDLIRNRSYIRLKSLANTRARSQLPLNRCLNTPPTSSRSSTPKRTYAEVRLHTHSRSTMWLRDTTG